MGVFTDWLTRFENVADPAAADLVSGTTNLGGKAIDVAGDLYKKSGLSKGFGRTLEETGDWIEGDASQQNPFMHALRKSLADVSVRPTQHAIEGIGGAIGGAAAATDQALNPNPDNPLSARLQGVVGGAKEGSEQAKDVVENVDVLTLAAGMGAGVLGKAARSANLAVDAAMPMFRTARALNVADVGLTIGDGLYGAKTMRDGLDEGDQGKVFEGVARMAGNIFGLKHSVDDTIRLAGDADVMRAYQKFEAAPSMESFMDVAQNVRGRQLPTVVSKRTSEGDFGDTLPIVQQEFEYTKVEPFKQGEIETMSGRDLIQADRQEPSLADMQRAATANGMAVHPVRGQKSKSGRNYFLLAEKDVTNPEVSNWHREMLDGLNKGDAKDTVEYMLELADEMNEDLVGRMADRFKVDPVTLYSNVGHLGGLEVSSKLTHGGYTYAVESGRNTPFSRHNKYFINPNNTMRMAKEAARQMTLPEGQLHMADIKAMVPEHLHKYVESRWLGGSEVPGLQKQLENALFVKQMFYNSLHESLGHAFPGSSHSNNGYLMFQRNTLTPGAEIDRFDILHNEIIKYMQDPVIAKRINELAGDPSLLADDGRIGKVADLLRDPKDALIPRHTDRPIGPTRNTAASPEAMQAVEDGAQAEVERLGPDIEASVQDRLKAGLRRHQRGLEGSELANKNLRAKQAELMRAYQKSIEGKPMTPRELIEGERQIVEGLRAQAQAQDPVPFTNEELAELMRDVDTGDAFRDADIKSGLLKLHEGQQLQPAEVGKLKAHFLAGDESLERAGWRVLFDNANEALGMTRSLMASGDLSAAGRQGLFASVMNPREASKAFVDQIRAFMMGTKQEFDVYMQKLTDPRYNAYAKLADASGLHISHEYDPTRNMDAFNPKKYQREEQFMHTDLIDRAVDSNVPGLKHAAGIVKRSERAYLAYLNRLRVELFNKIADKMLLSKELGGMGLDEIKDFQAFKDLAYMVNTLTGRGELSFGHISPASFAGQAMGLTKEFKPGAHTLETSHRLLTTGFFAPRFAASRAAILRDATMALAGGNLHPTVYKEYMRNVMGTTVTIASIMSALAAAGIGKLTWDPKKSDFGVLKIGNTRYDPWGGMKPWVKLMMDLSRDDYISSTGRYHQYGDYGGKSKRDLITNFILTKQSPAAGLIMEAITGESPVGKKRELYKGIAERYTPMIITNMYEIIDEEGMDQAALSLPFVALGGGTTTYNPYER